MLGFGFWGEGFTVENAEGAEGETGRLGGVAVRRLASGRADREDGYGEGGCQRDGVVALLCAQVE